MGITCKLNHMKKTLFIALIGLFLCQTGSAQVYMTRAQIDDMSSDFNDFVMGWEAFLEDKSPEARKEVSKGIFKLTTKLASISNQFQADLNAPASTVKKDPNIKLREVGADFSNAFNQVVAVPLGQSDIAKLEQHSANLSRLKEIFRRNNYDIDLTNQEAISQIESFKNSADVCIGIQKSAFLKAYNER